MEKSMKWYDALKILLPLWSVWQTLNFFASLTDNASRVGMSFFEILSYDWFVSILSIVALVGDVALMMILWNLLRNNDPFSVKYPLYLIGFTCGYSILYAAYTVATYDTIDYALLGSAFGPVLNRLVIFLPTYFYLKKRFPSPVLKPAANGARACSEFAVNIFDLVPSRLQGVADQMDRDNIVEKIFRDTPNPYTGRPITSEADWNAYAASYYAEKDEAARKRSEALHKITQRQSSLEHSPPEQRYIPHGECNESGAANASPDPQAEKPRPRYCRLCGAELHDDSRFCESCGQPVSTDDK